MRHWIRGRWRDTFHHADGTIEQGDWSPNQIQNAAAIVAASLFCRFSELPAGSGWGGILYMGIGSGLTAWDTTAPTQDPADVSLTTEYFRKAIAAADMSFSDGAGNAVTVPTRFILITITLTTAEANGSLREFGLYGGDATATLDSGQIINWVVHPRIDKDATVTITRTVEIEFLEP